MAVQQPMVVQQPVQMQQPMTIQPQVAQPQVVQPQVVQQVQPVTQQPGQQVVANPVQVTTLRDWRRPLFGGNWFGDCCYSSFCLPCAASG